MRYFIVSILIFFSVGCGAKRRMDDMFKINAKVIKTDEGVEISMDRPGKVNYTDGDVSASYDTKGESFLRTLTEAAVLKGTEKDVR